MIQTEIQEQHGKGDQYMRRLGLVRFCKDVRLGVGVNFDKNSVTSFMDDA